MRKLFLSLGIVLFGVNFTEAKTVVSTDIVVDTIWTKEMSPIFVEPSHEKDRELNIANGAKLEIQAGVTVVMDNFMNFIVTSQCLKGYLEDCYLDEEGKKKIPVLKAKGTKEEPIIFTSVDDYYGEGSKGDWGNFVLSSSENEVEYVKFFNGGSDDGGFFIRLSGENKFKNNWIENVQNSAVYSKSVDLEGNTIKNVDGIGLDCYKQCNVTNNSFLNIRGDAVRLHLEQESKIENNFFYQVSKGLILDHYFNKSVLINGNNFVENDGAVRIYHNNPNIEISKNNFFKSKNYAIWIETTDSKQSISGPGNWYGIDTGASSTNGEYFVSKGVDTSDFSKDEVDFKISENSFGIKAYEKYLKEKEIDTKFFETEVSRKAVIGKENQAGGVLVYEIELNNLKTKTIQEIRLDVEIPDDQELILCSISKEDKNYSLTEVCADADLDKVKFYDSTIIWKIEKVAALKGTKITFASLIKSSKKSSSNAILPKITFKQGDLEKRISYNLDEKNLIEKENSKETKAKEETKSNETKTVEATKNKTSLINRDELLKRRTTKVATNPEEKEEKTETTSEKPFLDTGVIFRKVNNGLLFFYLRSTENNGEYKLLNSTKWQELLDHSGGKNKDKEVRIYGRYYLNKSGEKTGIIFEHFHLK